MKNKHILQMAYFFVFIFIGMLGYFAYFEIFQSDDVINNTYNKRQSVFERVVKRGNIETEQGDILAETIYDSKGNELRNYPYKDLFCHTVGIASQGKSGIELNYDYMLLRANVNAIEKLENEFAGEKTEGDNVITTLNLHLQQAAYNALGSNQGAIICIEPSTGKIRAMISKPGFDANEIDQNWEVIINDSENSSLLNRGTNGLYTPGSVFKIFTMLEYVKENSDYKNYTYECQGSITEGEHTVRCYNGIWHGTEDINRSFALSCNCSFIHMGLDLNKNNFTQYCNSKLFNSQLPYDGDYKKSEFVLSENASVFDTMQTSIGQGKTLVTPLHMAMIASALGNNGTLMKPYLVSKITNHSGATVKNYKNEVAYKQLFTEEESEIIKSAMNDVVGYGTGVRLMNQLYDVYGKTGTAEVDSGDNAHSWFVGYAENSEQKIAICVLMEKMPPGSTPAVDAAKQVLDVYFTDTTCK